MRIKSIISVIRDSYVNCWQRMHYRLIPKEFVKKIEKGYMITELGFDSINHMVLINDIRSLKLGRLQIQILQNLAQQPSRIPHLIKEICPSKYWKECYPSFHYALIGLVDRGLVVKHKRNTRVAIYSITELGIDASRNYMVKYYE